jgi:hypothetical protein
MFNHYIADTHFYTSWVNIQHVTTHCDFTISIVDWLIIYRFTSSSIIFSLIWRRHHYRWRAAKFRPMLGAQGLWAGRHLFRATHAVTQGLGFSGPIRRTAPFSHLLRHIRECGESILTWILTGSISGSSQSIHSYSKVKNIKSTEKMRLKYAFGLFIKTLSSLPCKWLMIKLKSKETRYKCNSCIHVNGARWYSVGLMTHLL